jgi:hypothetical protein
MFDECTSDKTSSIYYITKSVSGYIDMIKHEYNYFIN